MILVDKRCIKCGNVESYCDKDSMDLCPDCNSEMLRIYGFKKPKEFIPGFYEHFEKEPIYIESREQYRQECEKRGCVQTGGYSACDTLYGKRKSHYDLNIPKRKYVNTKRAKEEAIAKACDTLGIE